MGESISSVFISKHKYIYETKIVRHLHALNLKVKCVIFRNF